MAKQIWGTFSVKDHCKADAFIADVMMFDRLVIPVPPDENERKIWEKKGWDPKRLERTLALLGERAFPVAWNKDRQDAWKTRYQAGRNLKQAAPDWAFSATRTELTQALPRYVTGIEAVTSYRSLEDLNGDLKVRAIDPTVGLPAGTVAAIVGREFLVPADPKWGYEDLLKAAIDLSSEKSSTHKRASFWRWHREFLDDKGITDQSSVTAAIEEMRDLLNEEDAVLRKSRITLGTKIALLVGSVALGLMGGPLSAVSIGVAFVSVGQFVSDRLSEDTNTKDRPVALLYDTRKHFGWN